MTHTHLAISLKKDGKEVPGYTDAYEWLDEITTEEAIQNKFDCLRNKLARMKKERKTKEQVYIDYRQQWHEKFKDLDPKLKEAKRMRLNNNYPDLKL